MVKASALRAEDPGFESCLRQDFSGSSHISDLKIGAPVATQYLPGAWSYGVSVGTGWPGVSIFLTFFIHTTNLGHCALLTPLCLQFLASVSRPLEKDLSPPLAPLSGTPYHYLSAKLKCFSTFKKKLKTNLFEKHLC